MLEQAQVTQSCEAAKLANDEEYKAAMMEFGVKMAEIGVRFVAVTIAADDQTETSARFRFATNLPSAEGEALMRAYLDAAGSGKAVVTGRTIIQGMDSTPQ